MSEPTFQSYEEFSKSVDDLVRWGILQEGKNEYGETVYRPTGLKIEELCKECAQPLPQNQKE